MPNELAYCEIFNPNFHGWDNDDNNFTREQKNLIYTSYLYGIEIEVEEFFNDDYIVEINDSIRPNHPLIRNWANIAPYKLEIVERFEIGDYTICVPKTFWLKLIQRKWKKYYHKLMAKCKNPRNLLKREIYGKW